MYYIAIAETNTNENTHLYNAHTSRWVQDKKIATGFMNKKYAEILKTAIELNSKMNLEVIDIPVNSFTIFKYGVDIEDIVDQFSTPDIDEAIAMAEADEYDEVVNNNTGEIIWEKGGEIMTNTNTNISIYDRIELGSTFHNNGTAYIILDFNKEADVALLFNPKNKFTPYVGANGLRDGHWCHGHYFQTIQEACDWYIDKCKDFE